MGQRSGPAARRQNELLKFGQFCIVLRQGVIQSGHRLHLEQFKPRNRQFTAQIEQLVLDLHKQFAHLLWHVFTQQDPNVAVEFIHVAHGMDPQAVF